METVSLSYVLGLLGLVSLVILGLLFVVYCHETGLKLNPKLSSAGWWRVVWSFLQSFWRSEKEIQELKKEIEQVINEEYEKDSSIDKDKQDMINPSHYKKGGIEAIDYMKAKSTPEEFKGHLRLTALKYLSRYGQKDNGLQELEKAKWYLDRLIQELKNEN